MIPELRQEQGISGSSIRQTYRNIFRFLASIEFQSAAAQLSTEAKVFLTLAHFDAEVRNGGLAQYFTNSWGKSYQHVLEGLSLLGLRAQERLVRRFLQLLPAGMDPRDAQSVGTHLFSNPKICAECKSLDIEYWEHNEVFRDALVRFALGANAAGGPQASSEMG